MRSESAAAATNLGIVKERVCSFLVITALWCITIVRSVDIADALAAAAALRWSMKKSDSSTALSSQYHVLVTN